MSASDQKELNNFLKQFPKDEIINTLNSIDEKIGALHTISSKDFLYFNTLLKEYYAKIKEISDANNILSVFFTKNLPEITVSIKEKNDTLKHYIDHSKDNNSKVIEYLSLIYASFDLIIVPFNNYKQNLITFKYILANLKLHLGYINLQNNNELVASVTELEQLIDTIYKQIDEIYTRTNTVSKDILNLKDFATTAHNKSNNEIFENIKAASQKIKKLSIEEFWPSSFTLDLTRRTQNCFANMGDVITNIQFHDIIRQKMEHIQSSQKTLIEGLNNLNTEENITDNIENRMDFIVKIPEITEIQVAQLLYTNKDYQTSIEKITSKLIGVGHEMKEINFIYNAINANVDKFEESFIKRLIESQESLNTYAVSINSNCSKPSDQFKDIYNDYETLKSDYNQIFNNEKLLRKGIKSFEKLIESNGKNFGTELVKRLIQLLSDLQSNSNSLKSNLNNVTTNYRSLKNVIDNYNCENKIFEIGSEVINTLNSESKDIKKMCTSFTELSMRISEEIASSIKKIEYYSFFKTTIEEIVQLLNTINAKVNFDNINELIGENTEILKRIEQLYTMKSERDIHKMLTETGIKSTDILEQDENNDIDNMDIELF